MPTRSDKLKIFVDTSAFVSLQDTNDPNHNKASQLALKLQGLKAKLYTSSDVIGETLTVISRKLGKKNVAYFYRGFLKSGFREIFIDNKLQGKTIRSFLKVTSKNISYIDCSSVIAMKEQNIDIIFAFDLDFKKLGVSLF